MGHASSDTHFFLPLPYLQYVAPQPPRRERQPDINILLLLLLLPYAVPPGYSKLITREFSGAAERDRGEGEYKKRAFSSSSSSSSRLAR